MFLKLAGDFTIDHTLFYTLPSTRRLKQDMWEDSHMFHHSTRKYLRKRDQVVTYQKNGRSARKVAQSISAPETDRLDHGKLEPPNTSGRSLD